MIRLLPLLYIRVVLCWVAQFNRQGIDGLIERHTLAACKINAEQSACYKELIEKPELAEQTIGPAPNFMATCDKSCNMKLATVPLFVGCMTIIFG